jgi:hypothetical protein
MMKALPQFVRTGTVAVILSAALPAQQGNTATQQPNTNDSRVNSATAADTYQKQQQGNNVGNPNGAGVSTSGTGAATSNPGFGPQAPNDVTLSGGQPHLNSTYQKDRNGNQGIDLGWIGLLGLAGLFGLTGRRGSTVADREERDLSHSSHMSRS